MCLVFRNACMYKRQFTIWISINWFCWKKGRDNRRVGRGGVFGIWKQGHGQVWRYKKDLPGSLKLVVLYPCCKPGLRVKYKQAFEFASVFYLVDLGGSSWAIIRIQAKAPLQLSKENIGPTKTEGLKLPHIPSNTIEVGDKCLLIAKGTPPWPVKITGLEAEK